MHRTLITLALVTTLALASLSEAEPRTRDLTTPELLCQGIGIVAYIHTQSRDAGVSYLSSLQDLRSLRRENPATSPLGSWLDDLMLHNLRSIYDAPLMTPLVVRREMELACLRTIEKTTQPKPTLTKNRY